MLYLTYIPFIRLIYVIFSLGLGLAFLSGCSNEIPNTCVKDNVSALNSSRVKTFLNLLEQGAHQGFPLKSIQTLDTYFFDTLFDDISFETPPPIYGYFRVHYDLEKRLSQLPLALQKDYKIRKFAFIKSLANISISASFSLELKWELKEKLELAYGNFIYGFLLQHSTYFLQNLPIYRQAQVLNKKCNYSPWGSSCGEAPYTEALTFWLIYHQHIQSDLHVKPFPHIQLPTLDILATTDPQVLIVLVSQGCCMNLDVYPYLYKAGKVNLIPVKGLVNYPGGENLPYFNVHDGLDPNDHTSLFYEWDGSRNILTVTHDNVSLEKTRYLFNFATQNFEKMPELFKADL
jgi:hypothetical protein